MSRSIKTDNALTWGKSPFLPAKKNLPTIGNPAMWQVLPGGARGLVLCELARATSIPWLVVAPDDATAVECVNDCLCFWGYDPQQVIYFPDNEILPYDPEPAPASLVRARATALAQITQLTNDQPAIIVTTAPALVRRIAGPSHWIESSLSIETGSHFDPVVYARSLDELGYRTCAKIRHPGDYAINPQTFDIFTTGQQGSIRIRFDSKIVTSIEPMHPATQRTSSEKLDSAQCMPAREVPIDSAAMGLFESGWRRSFGKALSDPQFMELSSNRHNAPLEGYLPLMTDNCTSLMQWLPQTIGVYGVEGTRKAVYDFLELTTSRFEELSVDRSRKVLSPELLWLTPEELESIPKSNYSILERPAGIDLGFKPTQITPQPTLDDAINELSEHFDSASSVLICTQTEAREQGIELIVEMLGHTVVQAESATDFWNQPQAITMVAASVRDGFAHPGLGIKMITEQEIFGVQVVQRSEHQETSTALDVISDMTLLQPGDPLVHANYGVGRFAGLDEIEIYKGQPKVQHLAIHYNGDSTIWVNMDDLDLVMRYQGGDMESAPFDHAGSSRWVNGIKESTRHAQLTAKQLLALYAKRAALKGVPCDPPGHAYEKFCRAFPFVETKDQLTTISDIIGDMTSTKPMDRIVSGDVGFGKTEVAMRAAFLAAYSGYQVTVLVPTTLLAQQHFDSFSRRFSEFEYRISLLTRSHQSTQLINEINDGTTDIIIATHRMFKSDVQPTRLGLLIIDEEHRFGVNDKERLTVMRYRANVLSMTATPIPRTLSMAMHGVRDISVIATPPAKRLSIRTFAREFDEKMIKEATDRELLRGGQVFFLHNETRTIKQRTQSLSTLMPNTRIDYAHGRMSDVQLEHVMKRFYHHQFDVLVCTTIIEIGIDIPNANTIFIENADYLGLAQLHQLRGRVGRSQRQAYCYLLKSPNAGSEQSDRRLRAMVQTSGLGEGLVLAHHDMEIRGAGEILGEAQAGDIHTIGFQLYLKILQHAIETARDDTKSNIDNLTHGRFDPPPGAYIPETYISNPAIRLAILSKLANLNAAEEGRDYQSEIIDRFGTMPGPTKKLFKYFINRCALKKFGVHQFVNGPVPNSREIHLRSDAESAHQVCKQIAKEKPEWVEVQSGPRYILLDEDGTSSSMSEFVERLDNPTLVQKG